MNWKHICWKSNLIGVGVLSLLLPVLSLAATLPWSDVLQALQQNRVDAVHQLGADERNVLQARTLMHMRQPDRALALLEQQSDSRAVALLKAEAKRLQMVALVRRAGGSSREVRLSLPDDLAPALARMDAQLDELRSLLQEGAPVEATRVAPARQQQAELVPAPVAMAAPDVHPAADAAHAVQSSEQHLEQPPEQQAEQSNDVAQVSARGSTLRALATEPVKQVVGYEPVDPAVRAAVLKAFTAWYEAWSRQDLEAYFSAYADDMQPGPRFQSIADWKAYKQRVISRREFITVRAEDIELYGLPDGRVQVDFLQHFRSDAFNSDTLKRLIFRADDAGWLIIREGHQG